MRILVLGAGAIGGYYGLQLAQAGAEVAFWSGPAARPSSNATGWSCRPVAKNGADRCGPCSPARSTGPSTPSS